MKLAELLEIEEYSRVYQLDELPYSYDALEPHIDAETMQEHHLKHHAKYVENLNNELEDTPHLRKSLEEILQNINSYSNAVRNNAGGVFNHNFFWKILTPSPTLPTGTLKMDIISEWETIEDFLVEFKEAGLMRFGSGWVWLVYNKSKLEIITTANQDTPMMFGEMIPIIGCDLWEHSYYLKHKSNRGDWIDVFFNLLNWDFAGSVYTEIKK